MTLETQTALATDPANPAPALLAGSATPADLRAALADAIQVRIAAEARAADADAIAAPADAYLRAARAEVARLEAERQEAERASTEARASAISEALRAGLPPPAPDVPPPADSAALTSALAAFRAIEAARADLGTEAAAAEAAADAAAVCGAVIDRIIGADARGLAAEWIAAVRLGWELQDKLTGIARMGAFLSHEEQAEILDQVDRRRTAIAADPQMIERHAYDGWLDRIAAEQQRLWLDYRRRLMASADATFDPEGPPTQ